MNNRIIAGIVTFNPNIRLLKENLCAINNQVEKVVIVDNFSNNIDEWREMVISENVELIYNDQNHGIAKALNQLCQYSLNNDYDWIFTLDQDSISPNNIINQLSRYIGPNIAIVAPNIIYKNNESFSINNEKIEEVTWAITSASLTNLIIWKRIGGFDENLFIDSVDKDYCMRARLHHYKIIRNNNVCLLHELGNLDCKKIMKKTVYVTNHSAKRKYYMVRNSIYMDKKFGTNESIRYIVKIFLKTIFFENEKTEKIKAIYKGICDGKKMMVL